ncbi:probable inactive leucine-rich repeat receptor-like protein kinase At3g03770 [Selaginella moellendorffii]|uniref:probable inactive leucine-rich repeat receptor-like protein kinase At3g03770 n=1 Tax=Selaginella moellendorffii TaxID=88036 RepID=UPI000D1C3F1F|nr:probable inactive leucine-rich repeat receptor-like protein kinase At3g03770 [Selaginella moellendorffii]XP_024538741.1 probable inactive leucine-rich repeat receptor-like protein kinase At3g03770 [Selaginella moellendorffii]XP_024538742.1 probable inactive leucine-rich repeat receptor-like protein kinase At3g03770 [Selaginella moellendorffii]XP_024538744.1 probable inactive leucine-rich repeat receptor-like protein kinase At3g03770 [Selaginella moellendorffii]XP_024538745.1 probable inactiv|eukprot:XP_024523843.1 probable inactive leucine-rich repeat receptor-like protein kinase At3g03770 [Selaginella moellendorffii]
MGAAMTPRSRSLDRRHRARRAPTMLVAAVIELLVLWAVLGRAALPGSQTQSLLRLQKLLGDPSALGGWSANTSFCSLPPSPMLNVSCAYADQSGTQTVILLQIVGDKLPITVEQKESANYTESQVRLPDDFSIITLANTLVKFPDLRTLTLVSLGIWGLVPASLDHLRSLELLNLSSNFLSGSIPDRFASLGSLQSLALDNNILRGTFPTALNVLPNLDTLQLSHNQIAGTIPSQISLFASLKTLDMDHNLLFGALPDSISNMRVAETISISDNFLAGVVPNLSRVASLRTLNLAGNQLGPSFPGLGQGLVSANLERNRFSDSIPDSLRGLSQLKLLNLSLNSIPGALPGWIFSLQSLETLVLDHNRLSGTLPSAVTLASGLRYVDISTNLLMGEVPAELRSGRITLHVEENCFSGQEIQLQQQQPQEYCLKAQRMIPVGSGGGSGGGGSSGDGGSGGPGSSSGGSKRRWKGGVVAGIAGGVMAVGAAMALLLVILLRFSKRGKLKLKHAAATCANNSCADTASVGVPVELLHSTRYLAQSGTVGATGPNQCRVFSLLELEEATSRFSQGLLIGEGEYGKVFRGKLDDGTLVAIKCLVIDSRQEMKQLKAHLEFLSRIRHRHLVSLFGYCLEREKDGPQHRRLYLVSEFIDNGTLRSHLFKRKLKESLTWQNRLVAALGAGRGIHYLHTGVVPGIFNNDVRITNILLDHNFVGKVSDFGLARHPESESYQSYGSDHVFTHNAVTYIDLDHSNRKLATDKRDVYNFGLTLLEIVLGRPPTVDNPMAMKPKVQELEMMLTDSVFRTEMVDSAISGTCSEDSLSTVLEIAAKCLSSDLTARPSMEDVLWNLQYAVQVQDQRFSGEYLEDSSGRE